MIKVTHKNGALLSVVATHVLFLSAGVDTHTKIHLTNGKVLTVQERLSEVERMLVRELGR